MSLKGAAIAVSLVRGKHVLVRADLGANSQILFDGAVAHQDGVILEVGPYQALRDRYPAAFTLGNGRQFLLPGLVNSHHHGRGVTTLQTGQRDDSLETWIHRGRGRRTIEPYLMALYTVMQQLRSGTTTVMFNQPASAGERVADDAYAALRAFQEIGVRVAVSLAYRNQCLLVYGDDEEFIASLPDNLVDGARSIKKADLMSPDDYLSLCDELASRYPASENNTVRVLLSPQNYHWCDEITLQRISEFARQRGLGIHTHLVETLYQRLYAERLHGQTPTRRLYEIDFLGPAVSAAHGVWLTQEDIYLLAETGTGVCHNPSSNLRLRSGVAPVLAMLDSGVPLALGTDSTGINDDDDMFQEMALALYLHRPPGLGGRSITAHEVLHMATVGGARVTGFNNIIGTLEPGRRADMVLLNWNDICQPYVDPDLDLLDVLVARARGRHTQAVMIEGRIVYQEGQFPGLDAETITREIGEALAAQALESPRDQRNFYRDLEPYILRFYRDWGLETTPAYQYQSLR